MNTAYLHLPSTATFDICKNKINIVQCRLARTIFRLGDVISVTFDFAHAALNCYHLSVFLESTEKVDQHAVARTTVTPEMIQNLTKKIHAEHHEFCLHTRRTHVTLCVPTSASPGFSTNLGMGGCKYMGVRKRHITRTFHSIHVVATTFRVYIYR